jgi:ribonuclease T1
VKSWALFGILLLSLACSADHAWSRGPAEPAAHASGEQIASGALPFEAQQTLRLIARGGPYPYERDGVVFGNFERALPRRERGYYREYTVKTPGVRHRGARRIIVGRDGELYYTEDHYRTFRRISP